MKSIKKYRYRLQKQNIGTDYKKRSKSKSRSKSRSKTKKRILKKKRKTRVQSNLSGGAVDMGGSVNGVIKRKIMITFISATGGPGGGINHTEAETNFINKNYNKANLNQSLLNRFAFEIEVKPDIIETEFNSKCVEANKVPGLNCFQETNSLRLDWFKPNGDLIPDPHPQWTPVVIPLISDIEEATNIISRRRRPQQPPVDVRNDTFFLRPFWINLELIAKNSTMYSINYKII